MPKGQRGEEPQGPESTPEVSPVREDLTAPETETPVLEKTVMEFTPGGASIVETEDYAVKDSTEDDGGDEGPEIDFNLAGRLLYGLFSPLTVPTIVCLLIFLLSVLVLIVPGAVVPYGLTVFGATCVVPSIALVILQRVGVVRSLRMFSRQERVVPYVIEFMALGGVTLFFLFKGAHPWIWTIYCGATALTLINFLINFRMRICCHCSATAALVAALLVINSQGVPQTPLFWWVAGAVLIAGYTGSAAVIYGGHSLKEVMAGYATGFLSIILFGLIH